MTKIKIMLIGLGISLVGVAQAQPLSADIVRRNLNHAVSVQQAKVQLTFTWEREIRVQDLMLRPARNKAGNTVVRVESETTSCQGVLLEGNTQVAVPAVCVERANASLQRIDLSFINGRRTDADKGDVSIKGELGYITLAERAAGSLRGLPVLSVRSGQGLQERFGSDMTLALHHFFTSFGIAFKRRVYVSGMTKRLQIGEPVFFEGKLVALVKHIPHHYGTLSGHVSEDSLALFRN